MAQVDEDWAKTRRVYSSALNYERVALEAKHPSFRHAREEEEDYVTIIVHHLWLAGCLEFVLLPGELLLFPFLANHWYNSFKVVGSLLVDRLVKASRVKSRTLY